MTLYAVRGRVNAVRGNKKKVDISCLQGFTNYVRSAKGLPLITCNVNPAGISPLTMPNDLVLSLCSTFVRIKVDNRSVRGTLLQH